MTFERRVGTERREGSERRSTEVAIVEIPTARSGTDAHATDVGRTAVAREDAAASGPPRRHAGLRLALLAFTQLIVALDYNIVYVALPDIGSALAFSAQSLQWVVSAYAVGLGGLLLLGGRAVDRLGPRRMFTAGLLLYGASSLVGGLADDSAALVAARAAQGVGGALLTPATLALIYAGFTEGPDRNRALAAWGTAGSGGLAAGALLGGVLTNYLGWEAVFAVNLPLAFAAALAGRWLLAADPPPNRDWRGFDLPGAALATAGSTLVVLGLVSGPERGWGAPLSTGSLVAGVALLGALLAVERHTAEPLVPIRLLKNRNLAVTMLVIALFQATLGGGYYLLTTYLQPVLGYSALKAGMAFLPLTLAAMFAAMAAVPPMIGRWGSRATLMTGMLVTGLGLAALTVGMSAGGSFWALLPGSVVWGFGGGTAFVTMFVSAGSGVAPPEQGVASGMATTAQQVGGAMGLAALVAVATAGVSTSLDGTPSTTTLVDGLHHAGWTAAATAAVGALVTLALARPTKSQAGVSPEA